MAEPFNAEQYRQRMSGQAPQGQAGQGQAAQGQAGPAQAQPQPYQPYQAPPQQSHMQHIPPNPYGQQFPPAAQPPMQGQMSAQAQPPLQEWVPQHQQMQQPAMMPPQASMQHSPVPPVFAPPPGAMAEAVEDAPKASRFKRKRAAKVKTPKVKKNKTETSGAVHTSKTSPAIIFMFGMATGIVAFLVGNMMMSNFLTDNSAKSFRDIERQNALAQQPVLPKTAQEAE